MIVDTSALMAILLAEPDGDTLARMILRASAAQVAAPTLVECLIVAIAKFGPEGGVRLYELLDALRIEVVPFDGRLARLAGEGFEHFGKGRHPAGLNFGDCFSYALARGGGEPLLFKGDDFTRTDIQAADAAQGG